MWSTMESRGTATVTVKANAKPNTTLYALQLEIVTNVKSRATMCHIVRNAILEMLEGGEEVPLRIQEEEVLNTESLTVRTVKITVKSVPLIGAKPCRNWISTRINNI